MARAGAYPSTILILALTLATAAFAAPRRPRAVIGRTECRALLRTPAVAGPAYEPGVDVNGRPVAPADVGGASPLGDITIDLRTLLGQISGVDVPPTVAASEIREGRIRIGVANGQVTMNGHPLGPAATTAARAACRKALAGRQVVFVEFGMACETWNFES